MKWFINITIYLLLTNSIFSQEKDSVFVQLKYLLEKDGEKMPNRALICQKTFRFTNRKPIREINYSIETKQIESYLVYVYDKTNNLKSKELFSGKDSLIEATKYLYDKKNRLLQISFYNSSTARNPVLYRTKKYDYLNDSLIGNIQAYNAKNKLLFKKQISYNNQGLKEEVIITYKSRSGNKLKNKINKYKYDSINNIAEIIITQKPRKGELETKKHIFSYETKPQVITENISKNGVFEKRIISYYSLDGKFREKKYNKNEELVYHEKSDFKVFFIDIGTHKSVFE